MFQYEVGRPIFEAILIDGHRHWLAAEVRRLVLIKPLSAQKMVRGMKHTLQKYQHYKRRVRIVSL